MRDEVIRLTGMDNGFQDENDEIYHNFETEQFQIEHNTEQKHPLKNPDSKHYQMIDGVESIERLEQMYPLGEMAIWAKITAMKYRLRICNKDAIEKEAQKIKDYENYYQYLKDTENEM